MAMCRKFGIILVIKEFKNWCYQKMSKTKKCAPKLIFFNEKKIEKDSEDFWHRKLTLKVKFWLFLTPPHYTNSQNSIISFGYVDFLAKIFPILYPPLENSTTRITIIYMRDLVKNNSGTWEKIDKRQLCAWCTYIRGYQLHRR